MPSLPTRLTENHDFEKDSSFISALLTDNENILDSEGRATPLKFCFLCLFPRNPTWSLCSALSDEEEASGFSFAKASVNSSAMISSTELSCFLPTDEYHSAEGCWLIN